ncbi:hypothetical protein LJC29_02490 [Bacteroides sp. OttesenSCG-928-N06]|nr:hypothetical protein [Bacteroides sp. OttesenSCG-928-N06]
MGTFIIIIILVAALALVAAILLYMRNRQLKKEKECNAIKYIHQQDRMVRELEHTRVEKETLERVIRIGIEKITGIDNKQSNTK